MNTEQLRAEFEAWCKRNEYDLVQRLDGTGYNNEATKRAWEAWQARAALQSQDLEDAERYRYLIAKLQQAYDGECFESDRFSAYCSMSSQYKCHRTIQAEITWRDKTDEPIGLSEAIDQARRDEENK